MGFFVIKTTFLYFSWKSYLSGMYCVKHWAKQLTYAISAFLVTVL